MTPFDGGLMLGAVARRWFSAWCMLLLYDVDEVLPEHRLRPGEEPGPAGVPPGEADAALAEQPDFAGVVHVLERVADAGLEGSGRGVLHDGLAAPARLVP